MERLSARRSLSDNAARVVSLGAVVRRGGSLSSTGTASGALPRLAANTHRPPNGGHATATTAALCHQTRSGAPSSRLDHARLLHGLADPRQRDAPDPVAGRQRHREFAGRMAVNDLDEIVVRLLQKLELSVHPRVRSTQRTNSGALSSRRRELMHRRQGASTRPEAHFDRLLFRFSSLRVFGIAFRPARVVDFAIRLAVPPARPIPRGTPPGDLRSRPISLRDRCSRCVSRPILNSRSIASDESVTRSPFRSRDGSRPNAASCAVSFAKK